MLLLDEVKLLAGIPLTSAEEREFGTAQLQAISRTAEDEDNQCSGRLSAQQAEYDNGRLDLKGAGTAFSIKPPVKTEESMRAAIAQLYTTISVVWRTRKERRQAAKTEYKTTCREAKRARADAHRQAKQSYASAVAELMAVEKQARDLATSAYANAIKTSNENEERALKNALTRRTQELSAADQDAKINVETLNARIKMLRDEIAALPLDRMFQRLDMGFLSMRKPKGPDAGLPLFAVFTDKKSEFELTLNVLKPYGLTETGIVQTTSCTSESTGDYFAAFEPVLRRAVDNYLTKNWMSSYAQWETVDITVTCKAQFAGVIPVPVRKRIHETRPLFDEILIVTEAPEWEVSFVNQSFRPVPVGDPLVIGRKGGLFWLIDSFDTTSAEEHVRREFTSDKVR